MPSAAEALAPDPALVARFARDLASLRADDARPLLVALSGGPDSVALLLLAHAALGNRCHAATVDHGLRPGSTAEARCAADLCGRLGIPHAILTEPLPDRVGGSANVSQRARTLRYRLLGEHAAMLNTRIATAHHADDQLETMIMRLNRGGGVGGLSGIRAVTGDVVRPLLAWRGAELAALVAAAGIVPVIDPSNTDDRYDRARLRKSLAGADWLDPVAAAASAAALGDADTALTWTAARLADERIVDDGTTIALDPSDLPVELLRRLVMTAILRVAPAAAPRGAELTAFIAALGGGDRATLAGVVADTDRAGRWSFRLAPPRRTT